ncbi:MAG: hypothetical protein HYZ18_12940 [Pseudogulbenkiania sp.]|nr:hypothetical protein [Pseudogulbenkiania sp.]
MNKIDTRKQGPEGRETLRKAERFIEFLERRPSGSNSSFCRATPGAAQP